jgi:hypothetical protein
MFVSTCSDFVEESAIAYSEFCIKFTSQFSIDHEAPVAPITSYDRAALVTVTRKSFSNKSGLRRPRVRISHKKIQSSEVVTNTTFEFTNSGIRAGQFFYIESIPT